MIWLIIGLIAHLIGQDLVIKLRHDADADTEDSRNPHGDQHVQRRFLDIVLAVMAEEREIGNFDP